MDSSTGVVTVPPNPENQIEATVVQESVKLPREYLITHIYNFANGVFTELTKIIAHSVAKA